MKAYYDLVDKLNTYLDGSPSVNTVTFGDIFKVDLSKQTIFPLAHINIQNVTFSGETHNDILFASNLYGYRKRE